MHNSAFFCFDCNRANNNSSIFCSDCFVEEIHQGHYYTVERGITGLCDCGSEFAIKKESFCCKHRDCKEGDAASRATEPQRREVELYRREMEFLFYIMLRVKREMTQ